MVELLFAGIGLIISAVLIVTGIKQLRVKVKDKPSFKQTHARLYEIAPEGLDSFAVFYMEARYDYSRDYRVLLGIYKTEDEAKKAIETNIRLFARSKAEAKLQKIRAQEKKPYIWPTWERTMQMTNNEMEKYLKEYEGKHHG